MQSDSSSEVVVIKRTLDIHEILSIVITAVLFLLVRPMLVYGQSAEFRAEGLVRDARERTLKSERYDGSYRKISYPMGDVPDDVGVCTDLVIRAYRKQGIDLQHLVHRDMTTSFRDYPKLWGLSSPDRNIDHRRVPNLQTFFKRAGEELPVSRKPEDYRAGDLVTWMLPGNLPHIGIVSDRYNSDVPLILHNIGAGPVEDDILFKFPITGHYRYPK